MSGSSDGFASVWLPWLLIVGVFAATVGSAMAVGIYWIIRLAVRHGTQDKERHA